MEKYGCIEIELGEEKLAAFYNNKELYAELFNLKENQYLLIKDSTGEVVDRYCYQNSELRQVMFVKLGGTFTKGKTYYGIPYSQNRIKNNVSNTVFIALVHYFVSLFQCCSSCYHSLLMLS